MRCTRFKSRVAVMLMGKIQIMLKHDYINCHDRQWVCSLSSKRCQAYTARLSMHMCQLHANERGALTNELH